MPLDNKNGYPGAGNKKLDEHFPPMDLIIYLAVIFYM